MESPKISVVWGCTCVYMHDLHVYVLAKTYAHMWNYVCCIQ
jgi:hypothetical protein